MSSTDQRYMALALSLGRRGMGNTWPNPAVGCVIVSNGRIVGRGWTQPGGRPHAERHALAQAGQAARGADVYVSLEPCAHHAKTPPCTDALIEAGVARVIVAATDHDPRVNGAGLEKLRAAGIAVTTDVMTQRAQADHAGFFLRTTRGRPFVTLKLASSFDGRIATASGESKWITGPLARRHVHAMRARHDAVMVGGGTARQDDPSLTVRDLGEIHQPARVILSRQLDLPLGGTLAKTAGNPPLILCHGAGADPMLVRTWTGLGATLLPCDVVGGVLDMRDVLQQLGAHGLTRVFCEGGAALAASLIAADLVDELIGFTAGLIIGAEGLANVGAMGLTRLDAAPRYTLQSTRILGPDCLTVWQRAEPLSSLFP